MASVSFFFGHGKLRYWYLIFYSLGLPVYLFGIYLLTKLQAESQPQAREMVLNIFTFGYLLLGLFSLINIIIYIHATKRFFFGFFLFIGVQFVFLNIGISLGNNYIALVFLFTVFFLTAVYGNLKALSYVNKPKKQTIKHHTTT